MAQCVHRIACRANLGDGADAGRGVGVGGGGGGGAGGGGADLLLHLLLLLALAPPGGGLAARLLAAALGVELLQQDGGVLVGARRLRLLGRADHAHALLTLLQQLLVRYRTDVPAGAGNLTL